MMLLNGSTLISSEPSDAAVLLLLCAVIKDGSGPVAAASMLVMLACLPCCCAPFVPATRGAKFGSDMNAAVRRRGGRRRSGAVRRSPPNLLVVGSAGCSADGSARPQGLHEQKQVRRKAASSFGAMDAHGAWLIALASLEVRTGSDRTGSTARQRRPKSLLLALGDVDGMAPFPCCCCCWFCCPFWPPVEDAS